jgi:hypothetical protein
MFSFLLSILSAVTVESTVGVPATVDYSLPSGWEIETLDAGEQWEVVSQDGGSINIIPLDLDTLQLPVLMAWNQASDTLLLQPPHMIVIRTMADTLYVPAVFPYPALLDIPAGFSVDYLEVLRFWLAWGAPPGTDWLLISLIATGALIVVLFTWLIIRRRLRSRLHQEATEHDTEPLQSSADAMALLESRWFTDGCWQELYADVDRLLRNTIERKFDLSNRALTYGQVMRKLKGKPDGRKFKRETEPLVEEITLQRYAGWGSSRDRAQRFIRLLAGVMETWR